MNRFDRVTSLLLLLQTRSVVTARFLADHFSVTERTIYRDIRTLENAGVPIGSEAGVGYFLEKGYRLPPVSFTLDEASAMLFGEKLVAGVLDKGSEADFISALNKVRAVLDTSDKDYLNSLDNDIVVSDVRQPYGIGATLSHQQAGKVEDRWIRECRSVLVRRQVVEIDYLTPVGEASTKRMIEPIGLIYYSLHWHVIAWCRLRKAYRDFRLDRIENFQPQSEQFAKRDHQSMDEYLGEQHEKNNLVEVELLFTPEIARFVGEQRYLYGFVSEERTGEGVRMRFLSAVPEFMARWLLHYTSGVTVLQGELVEAELCKLSRELAEHWSVEY